MKQIINELKAQPVIAWVTILGTALAIFLIMVVVMLNQVNFVPLAPETNRERLIYANRIKTQSTDTTSRMMRSSSVGVKVVDEVFKPLTTPEMISIFDNWTGSEKVNVTGVPVFDADVKNTDANFFRIYNFTFLAGKPYDEADVESHLKKAVINKAMAKHMFKSIEEAVGKEILIAEESYTVIGVVDNVSPVTKYAYSQIWTPIPYKEPDENDKYGTGNFAVAMLAADKKDIAKIKAEVKNNMAKYNAALASEQLISDMEGGPFTNEEMMYRKAGTSDVSGGKRNQYMLYLILLLIPAINLSTMTRSRLAARTGEIGVRRAFGATRSSIISSIITENMIITLAGGLIGLILSWIFGGLFFHSVYSAGMFVNYQTEFTPGAGTLFAWSTFAYVLIFCFVLNLISSGLPAIRASRINVVDAINAKK
ncbi:MAG: ABC transporter permease [Paramuribaculum sp.]|nr:ABC transporter permease [Paramuribaculum sp.]MDE5837230.1 ABC transporter permease [Paramuribaculum sp.]